MKKQEPMGPDMLKSITEPKSGKVTNKLIKKINERLIYQSLMEQDKTTSYERYIKISIRTRLSDSDKEYLKGLYKNKGWKEVKIYRNKETTEISFIYQNKEE